MHQIPEASMGLRPEPCPVIAGLMRVAAGLLLASSCVPQEQLSPYLRLSSFRQNGERNVYLNEPLVFDFSAELNAHSITEGGDGESGSVRVLDPNGSPVAGTITVNARQLEFRARLALLPDLSDGGFRPGTNYTVQLMGFPRPDGIRSSLGAPLEGSAHLSFRTALSEGPKPLFDPFLELGGGEPRMLLVAERIAPSENLTLVSNYAVDPRSLSSREFVLSSWDDLDGPQGQADIILRPRLLENRGLTERNHEEYQARIELVPDRALGLGRYVLTRVEKRLKNLCAQTLSMRIPIQKIQIEVMAPVVRSQELPFSRSMWGRYDEALGTGGSLLGAVNGSGATLRLLEAAGDGSDGERMSLESWEVGNDLQALQIHLGAGRSLDLSDRVGCVVLRAQGGVTLNGSLHRRLGTQGAWSDYSPFATRSAHPDNLGAWIARMRDLGEPWTVIVAGGDLRISGDLQVEGPLLLVAGGMIRVYDGGSVRAQVIYKSPEGGDNIGQVHDAPLVLKAPIQNRLAQPQVYGLLTRPFRPQGGVRAWLSAQVDADVGSTRVDLQFIGVRDLGGGGVKEVGPVASLDQLHDCQGIRLLLFVTVPAAVQAQGKSGVPDWQAPVIRKVSLSWAPLP